MKKLNYTSAVSHPAFDTLLLQAQNILEEQYLETENKHSTIRQLADIYRKRGLLEKAYHKYTELAQYDCEKYDFYLNAIFSQAPIIPCNQEMKASPFVRITNFLPDIEQSIIWETIDHFSYKFKDSRITTTGLNKKTRNSKVLYGQDLNAIAKFFLPKVTEAIKQKGKQLETPSFDISKKEMQLTLHTDGHFFNVHKDAGVRMPNRKITYVYYFYETPKSYKGGDLILYDTDTRKDKFSKDYTRIITQNNMLVLFPSCYYHQVAPVLLEDNDFRKGRFTINGWFHKT